MKQVKINVLFSRLAIKFGKNNKKDWSLGVLEKNKSPFLIVKSGSSLWGLLFNVKSIFRKGNKILDSRPNL